MVKTFAEKIQFLQGQSTTTVDNFFQLKPVTDVPREGAEVLYLKGVTPEALYTSYHDLIEVIPWLYQQGARSWCDVGCGVGRTCLMWTWLTECESFGIELVPERLEEARQAARALGLTKAQWIEADFASPARTLPESDVYFLYLATGPQLDAFLNKLKHRSRTSWVVVIESHGDLKPRLQWETWWLAPTAHRFSLSSKRHDPWIQVYRTRPDHPVLALEEAWEGRMGLMPQDLALHPSPMGYLLSKSYQRHWELVVEEQKEKWTMETLGLKWHDGFSIEGQHPPRKVSWSQVTAGLRRLPQELPYRQWADWRRAGTELNYTTRDGKEGRRVKIRKIIISPTEALEFSDGLRVEYQQIFHLEVSP